MGVRSPHPQKGAEGRKEELGSGGGREVYWGSEAMLGGVMGPLAWGSTLSPAVNLLVALSGLQAPYSHNKGID